MNNIVGAVALGLIIGVIVVYILIGLFLNSFNKLVEGRGSIFAFIPIGNLYLLGALTFNSTMGLILVLCSFVVSLLTFEPLYNSLFSKWLAPEIVTQISNYYSIFFVATLLMGIVKYLGLKFAPDEKKNSSFKEDNKEEQSKYENDQIITDSHNLVGSGGYNPTEGSSDNQVTNQSNNDDLIFTNDDSPMDETPSLGVNDNVENSNPDSGSEKKGSGSDLENFFN